LPESSEKAHLLVWYLSVCTSRFLVVFTHSICLSTPLTALAQTQELGIYTGNGFGSSDQILNKLLCSQLLSEGKVLNCKVDTIEGT
jgi:hypothetical protein